MKKIEKNELAVLVGGTRACRQARRELRRAGRSGDADRIDDAFEDYISKCRNPYF